MATPDKFTQQALANDPTFRQRLKSSMAKMAGSVIDEAKATVNHSARATYARAFLANPDAIVNSYIQTFVFRPNVFQSVQTNVDFDGKGGVVVTSTVTDAAIDSQVNTDWNTLAGIDS